MNMTLEEIEAAAARESAERAFAAAHLRRLADKVETGEVTPSGVLDYLWGNGRERS